MGIRTDWACGVHCVHGCARRDTLAWAPAQACTGARAQPLHMHMLWASSRRRGKQQHRNQSTVESHDGGRPDVVASSWGTALCWPSLRQAFLGPTQAECRVHSPSQPHLPLHRLAGGAPLGRAVICRRAAAPARLRHLDPALASGAEGAPAGGQRAATLGCLRSVPALAPTAVHGTVHAFVGPFCTRLRLV